MATPQADVVYGRLPSGTRQAGWLVFAKRRQFAWKTVLLALVTLALVPVLVWKHALAAQVYLGALVVIHLAGLIVFARGVRREDIAPSRLGLAWRAAGLVAMVALLGMIRVDPASPWFWGSLAGIWGLHTAGLALLHLRVREGAACPFLPASWFAKP